MGLIDDAEKDLLPERGHTQAADMLARAMQSWRDALDCPVSFVKRSYDEADGKPTFNETIIKIDTILVRYRWSINSNLHLWSILYLREVDGRMTVLPYAASHGRSQYGIQPDAFRTALKAIIRTYGRNSLNEHAIFTALKLKL